MDNHKQYDLTIDAVTTVRDSIIGEPALKSTDKRKKYLPPACEIKDQDDRNKYNKYVSLAEYDNVPQDTMNTLAGAIFKKTPIVEASGRVLENADGDGLTLFEHMQITVQEMLQMEYVGLLVEYPNVGNETQMTVAEVNRLGLGAFIKHYTRENIVNWWYQQVGGKKKLVGVLLKQEAVTLTEDYESETEDEYLLLGLDESGYFQQLLDEDREPKSERLYPTANGSNLDFIPFKFCIASERVKGQIPITLGCLYPIVEKSLHRMRVSADLKMAMYNNSVPTLKTSGWTQAGFEQYKEMTGNEQLRLGIGHHLPLPQDTDAEFLQWNAEESGYFKYMEQNSAELRAMGGSFDDTGSDTELATTKIINQAEKNGRLTTLLGNLEEAYIKCLEWVNLFDGTNDAIEIQFEREFIYPKLTPQERAAIINEYMQGLITRGEALRQLEKGGVLTVTAEEMINELDMQGI